MDAVEAAKSGHPGMPMGMADAATVLFAKHLNFDAANPGWADRDRFVLSAGHGSMLIYALLHLMGVKDVTLDEIKNFRQLGSLTPGHPEYGVTPGVETTTGPLGQGLANAVGMAMAEAKLAARFGADLVDHRTFVIAGDGCLMEGVSQEAISLAGHLKLNKLCVLWDDNGISIDGAVDLSDSTDQRARFAASGWDTFQVDGHDADALDAVLNEALATDRPALIAVKTIIGFGAPAKAGTAGVHGSPLGEAEIAGARAALDWPHGPFEVPQEVRAAWTAASERAASAHADWRTRLAAADHDTRRAFEDAMSGALSASVFEALDAHAAKMAAETPKLATRASSGAALDAIGDIEPMLVGGSADLTGSNNTRRKTDTVLSAQNPNGSYVHWGIREHAMAGAMNGMALHGGLVPFSGTFLCFADYCRPSIRLAALMGVRVVHVMTHDSIGLGEDGPTHQPVEHLASLRAMPNLHVYRPCDAVEAAECWSLALARSEGPSVLALSRQSTPGLRTDASANRCTDGVYELLPAEGGKAQATLIATGTEVAIAVDARAALQAKGIRARVLSAPCLDRFFALDAGVQAAVLGDTEVRVVIEAGVRQGWDALLRPQDAFIGMTSFGESAPAPALYAHFGVTSDAVVEAVSARV